MRGLVRCGDMAGVGNCEMMNHAELFVEWCCGFGPSFHNSPDRINLQFWLMKKQLNVKSQDAILTEAKILMEERLDVRNRNAKGKPPADKLLKEISPGTKQGKILAYILDFSSSVNDVCEEFLAERHEIMTQLNVLARTAGIGYSVTGDVITLAMPPGVTDPFEL